MTFTTPSKQARPFSADTAHTTKLRFRSSNCPTILKHEISNPTENFQPFASPTGSDQQFLTERPRTANSTLKMKFSFLQNPRAMASPSSVGSGRPVSGTMNSTVNFEFLQSIGKTPRDKFQDKSRIKPVKKLKMDQFHNVIYKVKQQKEVLEKEINRMEEWQKDIRENNIWNSPQSAIVNSILRLNAKANPDGSVSQLLQIEKEQRSSKKTLRPTSSQSHFSRRVPTIAKSVTDFFQDDDSTGEAIEEILGVKANPYSEYDNNKRKITDKINNYMDNRGNYHTLMKNTKNHITASPDTREATKSSKQLKESRETSRVEIIEEDTFGKSISQIVESHEHLEDTPSNAKTRANPHFRSNPGFSQTLPDKNRPFSANIQVHTMLSPKDFSAVRTTGQESSSPRGKPSPAAIHTRPHTAKQMKMSSSTPLAIGLSTVGEPRQTMGSVKFIPLVMAGQKIQVEPYNQTMNKHREQTMSSKGFGNTKEEGKFSFIVKGSKSSRATQNTSGNSMTGFREQEGSRAGSKRLLSGKTNVKTTLGTQTLSQQTQEGASIVGKVNIDAEYFENFADNPVRALLKSTGSPMKKNLIDSWTNKDSGRPYSRQAHDKNF